MKDSEYLKDLFIEYLPTVGALNEISQSFYSKDEYKLRHKIFKQIFRAYKAHKIKLFIIRIKEKLNNLKVSRQKRKKIRVLKEYEKLKKEGYFLPEK